MTCQQNQGPVGNQHLVGRLTVSEQTATHPREAFWSACRDPFLLVALRSFTRSDPHPFELSPKARPRASLGGAGWHGRGARYMTPLHLSPFFLRRNSWGLYR